MLANMEMLAVTSPAMKDILEKAKVIYSFMKMMSEDDDNDDKCEDEED